MYHAICLTHVPHTSTFPPPVLLHLTAAPSYVLACPWPDRPSGHLTDSHASGTKDTLFFNLPLTHQPPPCGKHPRGIAGSQLRLRTLASSCAVRGGHFLRRHGDPTRPAARPVFVIRIGCRMHQDPGQSNDFVWHPPCRTCVSAISARARSLSLPLHLRRFSGRSKPAGYPACGMAA